MNKPKDVDEYIASAPKEVQPKLQQLRNAIKQAAPNAEEKIGYGMPYYNYKGRLVYFGIWEKHIGLYVMPPTTEVYKKELKDYQTHKATVHLALDKELPISLIKRMIKTRVEWNENKSKKS